jgi:folate-binding protein YgfZ
LCNEKRIPTEPQIREYFRLENEYKMLRIRYGVVEGSEEVDCMGKYMPFELNLDKTRAIDMKKGCYLGQELVTRTLYKGVVRKRLCSIILLRSSFETDEAAWREDGAIDLNLRAGAALQTEDGTVGRLIAVGGNTGLAVIRLSKEEVEFENTSDLANYRDRREFAIESDTGKLVVAKRRYLD